MLHRSVEVARHLQTFRPKCSIHADAAVAIYLVLGGTAEWRRGERLAPRRQNRGQLGKKTRIDTVLRERFRVPLEPEYPQPRFDVHPNLPIRAIDRGGMVARRGDRVLDPVDVGVGSNMGSVTMPSGAPDFGPGAKVERCDPVPATPPAARPALSRASARPKVARVSSMGHYQRSLA